MKKELIMGLVEATGNDQFAAQKAQIEAQENRLKQQKSKIDAELATLAAKKAIIKSAESNMNATSLKSQNYNSPTEGQNNQWFKGNESVEILDEQRDPYRHKYTFEDLKNDVEGAFKSKVAGKMVIPSRIEERRKMLNDRGYQITEDDVIAEFIRCKNWTMALGNLFNKKFKEIHPERVISGD